jgi:hypothetical protein
VMEGRGGDDEGELGRKKERGGEGGGLSGIHRVAYMTALCIN